MSWFKPQKDNALQVFQHGMEVGKRDERSKLREWIVQERMIVTAVGGATFGKSPEYDKGYAEALERINNGINQLEKWEQTDAFLKDIGKVSK